MKFCSQCGTQLNDDAKFCGNCGSAVQQGAQQQGNQGNQGNTQGYSQGQTQAQSGSQIFEEKATEAIRKIAKLNDTPDSTGTMDPADIAQNKAMGILSYIGPLYAIPYLARPNSKFSMFHAEQGVILFILDLAVMIVTAIIGIMLNAINWRLGIVSDIISVILNLGLIAYMVLGIVNAAMGKAKELPFIGRIKLTK